MTWTAAATLKVKTEPRLKLQPIGFWFPVPPGLTTLPAMPPSVENEDPVAENAILAPEGFDPDNPDLDELFNTLLVTGKPAVYARLTDVLPGGIVPGYNMQYQYQCRIRVISEARMLPFHQNATLQAPARIKIMWNPTYRIQGNPITIRRGYQDTTAKGLYNITGLAVGLEKRTNLAAAKGVYTITGKDPTLYKGAALAAGRGTFDLTFPNTDDPSVNYWQALDAQVYGWLRDFYPDWWAD